jgi:hypothetical protein
LFDILIFVCLFVLFLNVLEKAFQFYFGLFLDCLTTLGVFLRTAIMISLGGCSGYAASYNFTAGLGSFSTAS